MKIICIGRATTPNMPPSCTNSSTTAGNSPRNRCSSSSPTRRCCATTIRSMCPLSAARCITRPSWSCGSAAWRVRSTSVSRHVATTRWGSGIDFTARDLQRDCIARGLPWEICKGFDYSAAVSPQFVPLAELGGDVQRLRFEMRLNGELRQRGDTAPDDLRRR